MNVTGKLLYYRPTRSLYDYTTSLGPLGECLFGMHLRFLSDDHSTPITYRCMDIRVLSFRLRPLIGLRDICTFIGPLK